MPLGRAFGLRPRGLVREVEKVLETFTAFFFSMRCLFVEFYCVDCAEQKLRREEINWRFSKPSIKNADYPTTVCDPFTLNHTHTQGKG